MRRWSCAEARIDPRTLREEWTGIRVVRLACQSNRERALPSRNSRGLYPTARLESPEWVPCVRRVVNGEITTQLPASFLQLRDEVELVLDEAAASAL